MRGSIDAEDSIFLSWRVTERARASPASLGVALMVLAETTIRGEV